MNPILIALLSPAIIGPVSTALISLFKRIPAVDSIENQGTRNLILRGIGAVLALGGVLGAYMVSGITPDLTQVNDILVTLALTFTAFIGSVGTHSLAKGN